MEYSTLIHEFLDGQTDVMKEDKLFAELSSNRGLRSDMKEQLSIKDAIRSDVKAYNPSAKATMNVFGALGFSTPTPPIPKPTSLLSKLGPYTQGMLSSVVTLTMTILVVYFIWPEYGTSIGGDILNNNNKTVQTKSTPPAKSAIPLVAADEEKSEPESKTKIIYKTKIKYVPVYIDKTEEALAENVEEFVEESSDYMHLSDNSLSINSSIDKKTDMLRNMHGRLPERFRPAPGMEISHDFLSEIDLSDNTNFSIEYSNNEDLLNSPNININPEKSAKLNNKTFGVYYKVTDYFELGGEYRRENFYQVFEEEETIDGNYYKYKYEQQPNFESLGLSARLKWWSILSDVEIYSQLWGGYTEVGPIGRAIPLGVSWTPYRNLSIRAGYELSALKYRHQKVDYYSYKNGLNFGIGLNF